MTQKSISIRTHKAVELKRVPTYSQSISQNYQGNPRQKENVVNKWCSSNWPPVYLHNYNL